MGDHVGSTQNGPVAIRGKVGDVTLHITNARSQVWRKKLAELIGFKDVNGQKLSVRVEGMVLQCRRSASTNVDSKQLSRRRTESRRLGV